MAKAVTVLYCRTTFEWRLFARMQAGFEARGLSLVIVTNCLSVWLLAQWRGVKCYLLRCASGTAADTRLSPENAAECRLGLIDLDAARVFQSAILSIFNDLKRRYRIRCVGAWSDARVQGEPAKIFARQNNLPSIFMELGNFDGKMFADPKGTNASSYLSAHPEILDAYPVAESEIAAWRAAYLASRAGGHVPPQARTARRLNWWYPVDWFGYRLLKVPKPDSLSLIQKLLLKLKTVTPARIPPVIPDAPYVFFPLQVSSDANLCVHSDVDNIDALELAEARARERDCLLVVKPHPAETDKALVGKIACLCAARGHMMTSYNTTSLVQHAEEVVTINSTVGLEAILLDKPVTVLGRSLFGRFTQQQAFAYVAKYLIDAAPYGNEDLSLAAIDRLLAIMGLSDGEQPAGYCTRTLVPS